MNARTYLAVPYEEREAAKGLGARFDPQAKAWFAPEGTALENGLNRWLPEKTAAQVHVPDHVVKAEFGRMLREAGAILDGDPIMDGEKHRVRMKGDKSWEKSGKYKGYLDKSPAGSLHDYRTGETMTWSFEGERGPIDAASRAAQAAQVAEQRIQRDREQQERYEAASKVAAAVFAEALRATPANPYCRAKGMTNPGSEGLRVVPSSFGLDLQSQGVKVAATVKEKRDMQTKTPDAIVFLRGDLLVPAYDLSGKLWSVQTVNTAFKSFMKGARKQGLHTMAGSPGHFGQSVLARSPDLPIVICEGRSTGDALARALGHPVVVAFDAGNLRDVATALRAAHPERAIIIAGDNDHAKAHELLPNNKPRGNRGVIDGTAAAEAVAGVAVFPKFPARDEGSDWNDLAMAKGLPKMRAELTAAIAHAQQAARATQREPGAEATTDRPTPRAARAASARSEPEPDPRAQMHRPARPALREASHAR